MPTADLITGFALDTRANPSFEPTNDPTTAPDLTAAGTRTHGHVDFDLSSTAGSSTEAVWALGPHFTPDTVIRFAVALRERDQPMDDGSFDCLALGLVEVTSNANQSEGLTNVEAQVYPWVFITDARSPYPGYIHVPGSSLAAGWEANWGSLTESAGQVNGWAFLLMTVSGANRIAGRLYWSLDGTPAFAANTSPALHSAVNNAPPPNTLQTTFALSSAVHVTPPPPPPPPASGLVTGFVLGVAAQLLGRGKLRMTPDPVEASWLVAAGIPPDLSNNLPIAIAVQLTGSYTTEGPVDAGPLTVAHEQVEPELGDALEPWPGWSEPAAPRASMQVWVEVEAPVVVGGVPRQSRWQGNAPATSSANQAVEHIAFYPTWAYPPPVTSKPYVGHWTVDDLPDPPASGYYPLGDAKPSVDRALHAPVVTSWKPNADTPQAPAWHSFYPFRPTVRAHDSYLPNGDVVHHPKGVHFNADLVEHLWLDWGRSKPQPFTWVIAAMFTHFPTHSYRQFLLDAGRNPDAAGFPRVSTTQIERPRPINDDLDYRTLLSYQETGSLAATGPSAVAAVRGRIVAQLRPTMYFGSFDGDQSYVGAYNAGGHRLTRGRVANTAAQQHRYYVMGRSQDWISQYRASHMLVFEIRYWDIALTTTELLGQYLQLASNYHFNQYRAI